MVTEITTQPVNTTVIALQDVTLTCSASVDDVTYSWHRIGGPLRSKQISNNTLNIHEATPLDEGLYYCKAEKSGISTDSRRVVVEVDGKEWFYKYKWLKLYEIYRSIEN